MVVFVVLSGALVVPNEESGRMDDRNSHGTSVICGTTHVHPCVMAMCACTLDVVLQVCSC